MTNSTITIPPQNGSVTHHQDQSITPISFSTTNTIPNAPKVPIPELLDELELELLMISLIFGLY